MTIRLGIIGCGIGQRHAENTQRIPDCELVALCDMNEPRLRQATDRFGCAGYNTVTAMLEQATLDGVLVCTPPYVRMPLLGDLARRGLAVFCEKPPAHDLATARAAKRVFETNSVINAVGFMYRWMQAADYLKTLIDQRAVLVCQITGIWEVLFWADNGLVSSDYYYRDRAGGPLVEQGVHLIDVARFILDDEITRIHARGANMVHRLSATCTTEETIQTSLAWRKGTLGSHVHCWSHHGHVFQLLVVGADFALTLDLKDNRVFGTNNGSTIDRTFDDNCYVTELHGFCDAIRAGDQSLVRSSYADACSTLAVASTGMQSLDLGIDLPVPLW